jgi:hypothetical protein
VANWTTATFADAFRAFFRRKIKATPFPEENGSAPFNASGVAQVAARRFVFVDNHDASALFEFELNDDEEIERIRRRALVGLGEGRLRDPEGLCRVDVGDQVVLIVASSLCVADTGRSGRRRVCDGLVRVRHAPTGDLAAEAMEGFREWLVHNVPSLVGAADREPDAGGLNVEGLAWDPRTSRLLLGLRGPVTPGRISLIAIPVDAGVAPWTTSSLGTPSLVTAAVAHSTAAQGIRDVFLDGSTGRFLILLGRSNSRGDEPFQLGVWDGTGADVELLDVRFHRTMKPEGVTTFSAGDEEKVLIVDDGGGYAVLRARREWLHA